MPTRPSKAHTYRSRLGAAVVTAFIVGTAACSASPSQPTPVQAQPAEAGFPHLLPAWAPFIRVEAVALDSNVAYHAATGTLAYDAEHTQHVMPPLGGRVLQVHVALGAQVAQGAPLLTLASPEAAQLQGEAHRAQLAAQVAQRSMARVTTLRRDGAIAEREAQAAEAELAQARAQVASSQAHLAALGLRLDASGGRATLVARQAGRVTERHVVVGQEVRADGTEPLLTLSNLDELWLDIDLFEQDLDRARVGAQVHLRVPAYPGRSFAGTVSHIGDTVDPRTRTIKVRATVANPDHSLKPEMFAQVEFEETDAARVWLPSSAVVQDHGEPAVLVIGDNDAIEVRPVTLGPWRHGRHRVQKGLAQNERVVTQGAPFVLQTMRD